MGQATSTLAFDISQFFPSFNHHFLFLILKKAGLDPLVVQFFFSYLVNRSTQYVWNNFSSHFVDVNVKVGQGSALSPILSALYLAPFLYMLEKHLKNLNLQVSLLCFIDNGLLITQSKSFESSNSRLYCSYNIALNLLTKFSFLVEYLKTKVFHFSRLRGVFNPSPLDLSPLEGPNLSPKDFWHYLSFIFDRKLSFHNHIDFYANKGISTVKCMKILGNSTRGLNLCQKTSPLQILCYANRSLQLLIIVLQQSPPLLPLEDPEQNTKKSSLVDSRHLQNVSLNGY